MKSSHCGWATNGKAKLNKTRKQPMPLTMGKTMSCLSVRSTCQLLRASAKLLAMRSNMGCGLQTDQMELGTQRCKIVAYGRGRVRKASMPACSGSGRCRHGLFPKKHTNQLREGTI